MLRQSEGNDDETREARWTLDGLTCPIAAGVSGRRVASRTKGQVGCSAIKACSSPVESSEVTQRCPSILPFCPLRVAEQFICPLLVRLSRLAWAMPVAVHCHKPRFTE